MSGTWSWTSFSGWTTSFGSSSPARPWRSASTQSACQPVRISCLCVAACVSEFHWVRYCWYTRTEAASRFDFSYVMPAAPNAVAGTVSP